MEKKVYFRIEYEGGTLNGAVRYYRDFRTALRVARSYKTRMFHKLGFFERAAVRVSCMENYMEVSFYYV